MTINNNKFKIRKPYTIMMVARTIWTGRGLGKYLCLDKPSIDEKSSSVLSTAGSEFRKNCPSSFRAWKKISRCRYHCRRGTIRFSAENVFVVRNASTDGSCCAKKKKKNSNVFDNNTASTYRGEAGRAAMMSSKLRFLIFFVHLLLEYVYFDLLDIIVCN